MPAALFLQESPGVVFDLRTLPPPSDDSFIQSGNALAGLIAGGLNPSPWFAHGARGWDLIAFTTYELLSFASWLLIGTWVQSGHPRLRAVMLAYLLARCGMAVFGIYEVGLRIQVTFWICLTLWLILRAILSTLLAAVTTVRSWSAWKSQ